jgi:hypothetical protein
MKLLSKHKPKVFCVGRGKTGTTSMAEVFNILGFKVGDQAEAELLIDDWAQRDFRRIIKYCRTADAFQDIPFSLDYTFQALDMNFPGSRFILTIRENSEVWYQSGIRFHTKIVNKGRLPTPDELKEFPYRYPGWIWHTMSLTYGIDETTLYDKKLYIESYEAHNQTVLNYFKHRPNDLLVITISEPDAMEKICNFLNVPFTNQSMPHLNKS